MKEKTFKTRIKHYLLFCLSVFLIGVATGVVNGIVKKKRERGKKPETAE